MTPEPGAEPEGLTPEPESMVRMVLLLSKGKFDPPHFLAT